MFDEIMVRLLRETEASRTTLRLDQPEATFPVVAEALAPGVNSIRDATEIDLRQAPTFQHLAKEPGLLIQEDLLTASPAPPRELIDLYGARAQMLAPIVLNDVLFGLISVHECRQARQWSEAQIESLRTVRAEIQASLESDR